MSDLKIPFGRASGTPIAEAQDGDLKWLRDILAGKIADGSARFPDRDQALIDACDAELARRSGGAPRQQRPPAQRQQTAQRHAPAQQAIARTRPEAIVAGSFGEANIVNAKLREMSERFHLVAPATVCGSMPEGCEVAISLVHVDSSDSPGGPGEVYPTGGGKLGLAKATLDRIAAAAGVTWDPTLCRRIDDGRDPHYVAFTAVGYVRNFDGSIRTLTATKEMDLRDGSPQIEALHDRIKVDPRTGEKKGDATKQIREMRLHILGHAETKAKLRAIRSMGIKTAFTKAELEKPFAVARLMFTGKTSDPELRREFALMNARGMIGGIAALYGGQAPTAQMGAPAGPQLSAPMTPRELDDDDYVAPEPPPHEVDTTGASGSQPDNEQPSGDASDYYAGGSEPIGDGYDDRGDDPNNY